MTLLKGMNMKTKKVFGPAFYLVTLITIISDPCALAQVPTQKYIGDQHDLIKSNDAKLAAQKKLVFDFWREVLEARHVDLAEKYMTESYIQHNPNVPNGRKAIVDFFSTVPPKTIEPYVKAPLITILSEGDLVTMAFVEERNKSKDKSNTYKTTWFDMFRIENGKIAEHWDCAVKD